jgi:hypothetical protein
MKTFMILLLLSGICFNSTAQKKEKSRKQPDLVADTMKSTTGNGVPDRLMEKFRKDYPTAIDVLWSKEDDQFKVIFKDPPNTKQMIEYDKDWKVVRRETELEMQQIPDSILNFYKENYPQERQFKVWLREDINGKTYYSNGTEFGLFFDMNGHIIRREPYK